MKYRRTRIGLTDLAEAMNRLDVTRLESLNEIAIMLGLNYDSRAQSGAVGKQSPTASAAASPFSVSWKADPAPELSLSTVTSAPSEATRPARAKGVESATEAEAEAETAFFGTISNARGAKFLPLFEPLLARSALIRLLKRPAVTSRPDIERMVILLAEARPVVHIPRLRVLSIGGPVAVIVDVSDAMAPYVGDARHLVGQIATIVPEHELNVQWADRAAIVRPDVLVWMCLLQQQTGLRVVVLSTFGALSGAWQFAEYRYAWSLFALHSERLGLDVTAVVPHRRPRWPFSTRTVKRVAWEDLGLPSAAGEYDRASGGGAG